MRIAFYAPLKPPDHPVASGDRSMARLLMAALARSGHEVGLASRLRSYDGTGDPARQARLRRLGGRLAERWLRRVATGRVARPDLWFTYHLYYKAPDWLGPPIAEGLGIPYVIAEASHAEKRHGGAWDLGHSAVAAALGRAGAVIGLNPADEAAARTLLAAPERWHGLRPFLAAAPFAAAAAAPARGRSRTRLAAAHGLDLAQPWLVALAMMRPGDKLASYRLLAAALGDVADLPWQLLVIGDGPARPAVETAFAGLGRRIAWLGRLEGPPLAAALAAGDLCVWPAINEAYGMALIEAQAAGLPVLAGASGGVPDIVADGVSGRLTPPGDGAAFAAALAALIAAPAERRRLGAAAARAARRHDISAAAQRLDAILSGVAAGAPS